MIGESMLLHYFIVDKFLCQFKIKSFFVFFEDKCSKDEVSDTTGDAMKYFGFAA
jgi:hypothetical protein